MPQPDLELDRMRAALETVMAMDNCPRNVATMQPHDLDYADGYNDALREVRNAISPAMKESHHHE